MTDTKFYLRIWVHRSYILCCIRVMAVVEGWAMCRRKGCMPFVMTLKELEAEYD